MADKRGKGWGGRKRGAMAVCGVLILLVPSLGEAAGKEVYRRVSPTEIVTGVVHLQRAFEVPLAVPVPCQEGHGSCSAERRFPNAYRIDFVEERAAAAPGEVRVEELDRGTVFLALTMEAGDESDFQDLLRRILGSSSAGAFSSDFAGLGADVAPFDAVSVGNRSLEPSWVLFHSGSGGKLVRFSRETVRGQDGKLRVARIGSTSFSDPEIVAALTEQVEAALPRGEGESLRTMPAPRAQTEEIITVDVADRLLQEARGDELLRWPAGVSLTRVPRPGAVSGGGSTTNIPTGCVVAARRIREGVEFRAETAAVDIDPLPAVDNAWISAWTLRRIRRRLGPNPEADEETAGQLLLGLIPMLPPASPDSEESPPNEPAPESYQVVFDDDLFTAAVGEALDTQASLDLQTLERLLTERPQGLVSDGWLLVICREDGTADYFVPPTAAMCHVTNPEALCGAFEQALD